MTTARDWSRVKSLFIAALDLPESAREEWVATQCGDDPDTQGHVRSLLVAHSGSRSDLLSRGGNAIASVVASLAPPPTASMAGSHIGPYLIVREIGAGGMGRVFLARREDGQYRRQVALKLIRDEVAGPELLRRFLRERDTLARLAHPNIATLLDGGVEGASPYFTMEYVEGDPIDAWCDRHRLDVRARVALVVRICDAVQYAHRNLIVHRDIKPSNILVGADGEPKLLDFGIAKPIDEIGTGEHTGTAAQPMTREYAAPEQVLGEPITIATDEYAIGVLLYRLLSGRMPYARAERDEISWAKGIMEEVPEALDRAVVRHSDGATLAASRGASIDALRRALRGDLENVVQRALAKSPEARYPTVGALGDDLRAYLDGRALSGGTRRYRARKFVQRHKLPLAAGVAALLAIVVGTTGIAFESHQRRLAAEEAVHESQTSAAVKDFVIGLFEKANPNEAKGKLVTLRDAVDLGVKRLDRIPADQPLLKAELQVTLSQIYFDLDDYGQNIALASQAFDALKSSPESALLAARAERLESTGRATVGDLASAQTLADDAATRIRALPNAPTEEIVRTLYNASWIALKRDDLDRVKRYADEAEVLASRPPVDESLLSRALQMKGDWARRTNELPLAVESYRRALTLNEHANGRDNASSVTIGHTLALSLASLGRYDESLVEVQRALDVATRLYGETGSRVLRLGEVAGVTEYEAGRLLQARDRYAGLLAVIESQATPDESMLAEVRLNYAEVLCDLGRFGDAGQLLAKVRDFLRAHRGSSPNERVETLAVLARVDTENGRLPEAEADLREAQDVIAAAKQGDSAIVQAELGRVRLLQGNLAEALELERSARDNSVKNDGERSFDTASIHCDYGNALAAADLPGDADAEWRAALASYSALLPPDGMYLQSADARIALGEALVRQPDRVDEGLHLLEDGVALRRQFLGADDARAKAAEMRLAEAKAGRQRVSASPPSRAR